MPHDHVGIFFVPLVTPEPQAPPLTPERERSGRVLDLRPRDRRFEPYRRHCIVVLEQDTFILA